MIQYFNDSLYKNTFFIVLTRMFNEACGFFFWMAAAKIYSVEDVGIAVALISVQGLLILLSRLGFDVTLIRFYPLNEKMRVLSSVLIITTASTFLIVVFYFILFYQNSEGVLIQNKSYMIIFLFATLANSISTIIGTAFVSDRKGNLYFYQNILMGLRIPLLFPLAFLGSLGIFSSVGISFAIASIFSLGIMLRREFSLGFRMDNRFLRDSFRFTFWSYLSNLLQTAPTFLLPIIVLNLLGEVETGKYYIAFMIGSLGMVIPTALGTSLFVEGSHGENLKRNAIKAAKTSIYMLFPPMAFLFFFGKFILGLLRPEYIDAIGLVRIIILSNFLGVLYVIFIPIQKVRMRVKSTAMLNGIRFIFILLLSYILIPNYGIVGVGYAWTGTYLIVVGVMLVVARRDGWF